MIRHGKAIGFALAVLVAAGVFAETQLPRSLYPELSFPRIVVVANLPDATTQVVMLNVSRPLEEALMPLLGVRRVRSRTIRGAVEVSVLFEPQTDMVLALQLVQARLADTRADLPLGTQLSAERITPTSFPVFTLNVDGELPPAALRDVALYQIRPALSRVPGVGPITVGAAQQKEISVEVDPSRLQAAGLTAADVVARLTEANTLVSVGRLDVSYRRFVVVASGLPSSVAALGDAVVGGSARVPVRLADVATISEGQSDERTIVRSPRGLAAVVSVARRIGGDVVSLNGALMIAVASLRKSLPAGVHVTPVYDQSGLIASATSAVRDAILLGSLFSALIIFLFLRDRRATLLAAIVIPSSLAAACAVLLLLNQSLNLMSLGGLAIAVGLVIDDAVVIIEGVERRIAEGVAPRKAAQQTISALGLPVFSSTLTTVVVFAPLGFLSGVVGTFFSALSLALAAAVTMSLLLSLTVTPILAARARPHPATASESRVQQRYDRWLNAVLARWRVTLLVALGVVACGAAAAYLVETDFIPELDEGAYVLDYFAPLGTSLAAADRLARKIDDMLRADPDVETFNRRLGAELGPVTATEASRGDIVVRLKAHPTRDIFAVMEAQRSTLAHVLPGVRVELRQLLQDMLDDLEGSAAPIEVKIYGDNPAQLRAQALLVAQAIGETRGLVDLYDGQAACSPERSYQLDQAALGRAGLTAQQVTQQMSAALLGQMAPPLPSGDRLLPVRVRWPDAARFDPIAIAQMKLKNAQGAFVPLSALGKVVEDCAPSEITRENLRLMVHVTARLENRDLGSASAEVESKVRAIAFPPGVEWEIGGQRESQQQSFRSLAVALAVGLLLVLIVLVAQFGNFFAPLSILAAVPVALSGGLLALLATGTALNVSSLLGGILLVGLVVKNGILLLQSAEQALAAGENRATALRIATRSRLRPILMTTLCTLVGLVPLALGWGAGADMHRPLAIAVIGGLSLSTVATLFFVPAIYLRGRKPTVAESDI